MRISVKNIQESVAADFGIPASMMVKHSKRRRYTVPRLIAFKLARELTPLSYPVIAKLFDRDHTTVIYGVRAANRYLSNDRDLALKVEARKLLLQCQMQKFAQVEYQRPVSTYDRTPWCPPQYRDDYRNLRTKGFSATEARPMIEEMIQAHRRAA